MNDTERVAQAVEAHREAAGISVASLADRSLIPRPSLIRKLGGATDFKVSELIRIAIALEIPVAELLPERAA